jgi:uncharacterized protein (TIGR02246 family)
MSHFTRQELEDAFQHFQDVAVVCGETGDWNGFAELFTEDATYIEHHLGTMHGREEIRAWIVECNTTPPITEMKYFPIEWYVIDESRGWVICQVWNRMTDPGDGSVHQAYNFTLLKYAGDNLWSYEEDIYNPVEFQQMIKNWRRLKQSLAATA